MPSRSPLSPIFDPGPSFGSPNIGAMIGAPTIQATVSPGVVTIPVQVLTPTVTTFTPSNIPNLADWRDASATADITKNGSDQVTAWAGHLGFAAGGTLTRSASNAVKSGINTQNGLNVVTFLDGYLGGINNDFMYDTALNAGGAISVFIVANPTSNSPTNLEALVGETNSGDANSQLSFRAQTLSSPADEFIVSGAKVLVGQWLTAGSGSGIVGGGYRLLVCQIDCAPATDTWAFRVDEVAGNSGTFTLNTTTSVNTYGLGAMNFTGGATHFLRGHIAEVLVYTRKLTAGEVLQVESYLAIKWGI